jgi:tetratricopeptide (TPR) repeat protein
MSALGKIAVLPVALIAMVAMSAGAQQKQCEIDEGTPSQIGRATLSLNLANGMSKPEDAAPKLRDAVKLAMESDPRRNPAGKSFVLGKALVTWMSQPGIGYQAKRGTLGFVTDTGATVDLVSMVDSLFTAATTAIPSPECAVLVNGWRQQRPWVELVNKAIELANTDKPDSAEVYARMSIKLASTAPYGYMVLGQLSAKRSETKEALSYYKQAIAAATDTSLADQRRQMLYSSGMIAADAAEADGPDKAFFSSEARAAFDALAKDPGTRFADAARSGLARLATAAGDTAAIKASYADQLANPAAFSYVSLMQAAVIAARAQQTDDAIKLFEATYALNPYHRDVLYNLARLYLVSDSNAKAIPLIGKLVSIDPSNPDDYQLLTIAYAAINKEYALKAKATKVQAAIKANADSARFAVDSALKYKVLSDSLPASVVFTEFNPGEGKTTLGGTLSNNTDQPKSFNLKIEFLDKGGAVVATQEVPVGPVPARGHTSFSASGMGAGIIAFKYAPLR